MVSRFFFCFEFLRLLASVLSGGILIACVPSTMLHIILNASFISEKTTDAKNRKKNIAKKSSNITMKKSSPRTHTHNHPTPHMGCQSKSEMSTQRRSTCSVPAVMLPGFVPAILPAISGARVRLLQQGVASFYWFLARRRLSISATVGPGKESFLARATPSHQRRTHFPLVFAVVRACWTESTHVFLCLCTDYGGRLASMHKEAHRQDTTHRAGDRWSSIRMWPRDNADSADL